MHLVSQKVIADAAGVSQATVNRCAKRGEELWPARVKDKLDIENPATLKFIEDRLRRHTDASYKADRNRNQVAVPKDDPELMHRYNLDKLAKNVRELADKPLTELVRIFGDDLRFLEWLKSLKEIESLNEKRIKNAELRGELVRRDAVQVGVIDVVDELFRQILQDGCKNMATKAASMAKSGRETNEITEQLRAIISTYFKNAQRRMIACMDSLRKDVGDA